MEMYTEKGESRKDCELKIAEKYKRPFQVYSVKPAKIGGGPFGLFGKDGVEVEFYFTPVVPKTLQSGISAPSPYHAEPLPQPRLVPNELAPKDSQEDLEEKKRQLLAIVGKDPKQVLEKKEISEKQQQQQQKQQQQILELLHEVNEKLDGGARSDDHPSLVQAGQLLKSNDFSEKYTKKMLERLRKLPYETLENFDEVQDQLVQWIGESITIYDEKPKPGPGRVMVLIGPTGVGKTTTIAKLAALYGVKIREKPAVNVRMITIDQYRIGAIEQLESFGKIMKLPVVSPKDKHELKNEIATYSEVTDLFLVDTFGRGPKDAVMLGVMKEFLEGCPKSAEVHLVIAASTKASDIEEILRQFEPFNYLSVLLTKWDETNNIGNVISALAEKGKSVSFITDGQKVPQNIKRATVQRFLLHLGDFKIDREKLKKCFPAGKAEQLWG